MKKLIQRWLGINEHQETPKLPSNVEVRGLVGQALSEALQGCPDYNSRWHVDGSGVQNALERVIERACEKHAKAKAESVVIGIIGNESFIDGVVERINRKQVPSK